MGRGMIAKKPKKRSATKNQSTKSSTAIYTEIDKNQFINNVRSRVQNELAISLAYQHNIDMLSFLLALRDEFSFGKSRLLRVLARASKHAEYAFTHNMTTEDLIAVLEEETGLTAKDITFEASLIDSMDLDRGESIA